MLAVPIAGQFAMFAALTFCLPAPPVPAAVSVPSAATRASAIPLAARVDINHATIDELLKVPGMTRSWAGRIVRFRPYRTKQDLIEQGIVPSEVYDHIKDYVVAHRNKQ